jgi:hypothetical protein
MNSKTVGERSEAMVLSRFLQLGYIVLIPFGDNQRYDFVIDRGIGLGFEKIQVKTARLKEGFIEFNGHSSQCHRGKGSRGYKGECDYFAAYCPQNNECYFIKVDDCTHTSVILRLTTPKNNQKLKVKYAKDYILAN